MARFEVGAEDLLHSRFAVSPAFELDGLLRLMSRGGGRLLSAWSARLLPAFDELRRQTDLDAVLALQADHQGAGFVAVPPVGMLQTWEDDLAAIRSTTLERARAEIAECLAARPTLAVDARTQAVLDAPDVVARLAVALRPGMPFLLPSGLSCARSTSET
ncbi:hypothetical protein [Catenulispora subtropica]|uniref:Uncharacterized protein n=1 Tax=Catenulispora subtropica TaxID=450798 RepID=A0ABP5E1I0_9ACTN